MAMVITFAVVLSQKAMGVLPAHLFHSQPAHIFLAWYFTWDKITTLGCQPRKIGASILNTRGFLHVDSTVDLSTNKQCM